MFAPGVTQLMLDFHSTSSTLSSFVVSVYVLGFATGPLILAPLAELYGRLYVYHVCNVLFIVFTVACAVSSNLGMLIGFRFLEGCAGSAPLTLGGGTIADLIPQQYRGTAMAMYTLGPVVGPVIGPVAGGYLAEAEGWRWVFWLLGIAVRSLPYPPFSWSYTAGGDAYLRMFADTTEQGGVIMLTAFICMRETYAPVLLERKTKRLQRKTGDLVLRSAMAKDPPLLTREIFLLAVRLLSSALFFCASNPLLTSL
jgi:multidrug resistance protein